MLAVSAWTLVVAALIQCSYATSVRLEVQLFSWKLPITSCAGNESFVWPIASKSA
jgi:hypothetical protein